MSHSYSNCSCNITFSQAFFFPHTYYRMDSFVLAETLKYLYLLFANKEELTLEVDDFVFTTEAHLLPLSLARINNVSNFIDVSFCHCCFEWFYSHFITCSLKLYCFKNVGTWFAHLICIISFYIEKKVRN